MKKISKSIISSNRKASFNYEIKDTYEAGIELKGTEVKSLRNASVNLKDSYCVVQQGQIFVFNMYIAPYEKGNIFNKDPLRKRKLLMHKKQIDKLLGHVSKDGLTLVVTSLYLNDKNRVKARVALARGKNLHDKREALKRKEADREARSAMKNFK